ncbi:hypothetical protein QTP88_020698 [Uroleucon formosanum]
MKERKTIPKAPVGRGGWRELSSSIIFDGMQNSTTYFADATSSVGNHIIAEYRIIPFWSFYSEPDANCSCYTNSQSKIMGSGVPATVNIRLLCRECVAVITLWLQK